MAFVPSAEALPDSNNSVRKPVTENEKRKDEGVHWFCVLKTCKEQNPQYLLEANFSGSDLATRPIAVCCRNRC
jgi:hypothetical protein